MPWTIKRRTQIIRRELRVTGRLMTRDMLREGRESQPNVLITGLELATPITANEPRWRMGLTHFSWDVEGFSYSAGLLIFQLSGLISMIGTGPRRYT
jgi:hypothetical protein